MKIAIEYKSNSSTIMSFSSSKFINLLSLLPDDAVDKIYEFSGYKNDLKKYFQRNVLTLVDPTICFLSNKHCNYCFVRECEIRNGQESFSDSCYGCKQKRKGDVMVSAHDANKQWRPEYKLLILFGVGHWKKAISYWVPSTQTFVASEKCHPITSCVNNVFSRCATSRGGSVTQKARDVAIHY